MASIRIIKVPPGEAPARVRRGWVGLTLPLDTQFGAMPRQARTFGVLTGPRRGLARLLALRFGGAQRVEGYVTDARRSVDLLGAQDPDAAIWWHEHAPHMLAEGKCFVFPADVCELVPDPPRQENRP
ncbi:MAG TPA: hypothetical protein VMT93_04345 [Gemmatimonadaceae bacterium]|nr:hypothetical protein [Gemmatimonadaceae bacterium]